MNTKIKDTGIDMFAVAPGVWGMKDIFVNLYIVINTENKSWVLVDAGLKTAYPKIKKMAALLFGTDSRPSCIILTHGHFDHNGSVKQLADEWDVPVYAHYLELPYLTGLSRYPPGDPSVNGGLMAEMAWIYPRGPIDISHHVRALPDQGQVPSLPEWTYYHTPGHSPGHISLFRKSDGVLIAGDAFVTTQAESALYTMLQKKKLSGPPKYFTPDWQAAAESVKLLDSLEPEIVATGHGVPMEGAAMRKSLHNLSRHFQQLAVPTQGRYVSRAALMDETGVVFVPDKSGKPSLPVTRTIGISALFLTIALLLNNNKKNKKSV